MLLQTDVWEQMERVFTRTPPSYKHTSMKTGKQSSPVISHSHTDTDTETHRQTQTVISSMQVDCAFDDTLTANSIPQLLAR